jgi:erythronate-4-phosphate dehydrogenase
VKIVADEKIPLLQDYFGASGELVLKPGRAIQAADVAEADMLVVRSVTKVNAHMLENSRVKFVGCVTAGTDHLDTDWLDANGIKWMSAAGSNATAVVEYIVSVIAALQKMDILTNKKLRAGVVGVGRIGRQVATMLEKLGFDVVLCDPVRALTEPDFHSTPLDALADCDLISLHTPLTHDGQFPTYHMIDKKFLLQQKKNCVLLSAGRGAVIDFSDLKEYGERLYWCLDVWENEPLIDIAALELATIATPHIAGHTLQAKQRGLDMVYQAALKEKMFSPGTSTRQDSPTLAINCNHAEMDWRDVVLKIYDPRNMTAMMKEQFVRNEAASVFDRLRNDVNLRHEFDCVTLQNAQINVEDKNLLFQLGLNKLP